MDKYQVVKADTPAEALEKSHWKIRDKATVVDIAVIANGNGTFSLFPKFERDNHGTTKEKT
tara:strand:+ start:639 stop:821 length:183 start_codon:yes stop_codon:yes gene_type:complete